MRADGLEYAGFWIRLGATLIDVVLLMLVTAPLLVWIYGWGYYDNGHWIAGPADFLISWVAPAIATMLFWRYREATPGKMLLSLRIVDAETGEAPSVSQAVGRYFAYLVSMVVLCLGFVWIGVDPRKQGWHDKLAGTVVVRSAARA
jgi:uncharacterized RDD family membrane protein YckC